MSAHFFSRRAFLRGVGVTMALPWMESLPVWGDTTAAKVPGSQAPVLLLKAAERRLEKWKPQK